MDFVTLLALAQKGAELLMQGRQTITKVRDALNDGQTAAKLTADQKAQLEETIAKELEESRAANRSLNEAIDAALR